jgi:recombination protein RecR
MTVLDRLIRDLARLPGLGKKSAARIAYHLLAADQAFCDNLADEVAQLKSRIRPCTVCHNYCEAEICPVCADPSRDQGLICVVEQSQDIFTMEATGEYKGLYHVLRGVLSPLDSVGPEQLTIAELIERAGKPGVREVIIATNPTLEGDTTGLYITKLLSGASCRVSRLALGLPVGGDLEYTDKLTLARSFRNRTSLS